MERREHQPNILPVGYPVDFITFKTNKAQTPVMTCKIFLSIMYMSGQELTINFSTTVKCHLMARSFLREKTEPTIFGIWPVGYSDMNSGGLDQEGVMNLGLGTSAGIGE